MCFTFHKYTCRSQVEIYCELISVINPNRYDLFIDESTVVMVLLPLLAKIPGRGGGFVLGLKYDGHHAYIIFIIFIECQSAPAIF